MSTVATTISSSVFLYPGGRYTSPLTITATGAVYASNAPAGYSKAGAVVVNQGKILGAAETTGIWLNVGGYVNNTGLIKGDNAIEAAYGSATVINSGTIEAAGTHGSGVSLERGGSVTNTGRITGRHGIEINSTAGMITNFGTILGTGTSSSFGVMLSAGQSTLFNYGMIGAASGPAVALAGTGDRLIVEPGASFAGAVDGDSGALELASAASAGMLSGLGTQFINFAQTTIDANASWTLTGTNTLAAGATLTNDGTLTLLDGTLTGGGSVINNGSIIADPSTLTLAALSGTGEVVVDNGSTVTTLGTVTAGETIAFSGGNGDLNLAFATFAGTIAGLDSTDTIALAGVADATSAGIVNGNTLQIQRAGNPAISLILDPARNYAGGLFSVDGNGAVSNALGRTLSWTGGGGGTAFGTAANWDDITSGLNPAQTAPTAVDTVDFDTTSGGVSGTGTVTAVHVGSTGDGVLELGNGATIAADSLDAGIAATAAGQIGLFGAGTELIVAGALTVGDAGDGRLSISPGATVTAGSLDEAAAAGGSGGISLSGTGAALNVAGALSVGDRSSGSLNIANGAIVTAGSLTIGAGGSGSGNVVIGPGSHLNLTGTTINVGLAGSAVLDIQGGTLGLASGTTLSPGTFGRIVQVGGLIDPGATLDLSGASLGGDGTVEASVEILNTSLVTISGESETLLTPLITSGDTVNIAGVWSIKTGGTLVLDANTVDNSQTISFGDLTGALVIGQQVTLDATQTPVPIAASAFGGFAAPIVGYKTGDMIAFTGLTVASDSVTGNVVTLFDAQNVTLGTLTFQTAKGGADNAGAIAAAAQIACFAAGTLIETVAGPRAVETLRIGDDVVTLPGAPGRIVWVGARRVDCARHPRPETVWPVRIARHAFGENVPARDLFVSPDHAIYVDGVLIPAKLLLNGTTIRQVRCRRVAYHHVELARHDVILAEGLPAETYLDTGDRAKFTGGHVTMPHPDFTARMWEALGCAPLFVTGPRLDAVRRCVNARAAEQAPHPPGVLDPAIRHGAVLPDRMIGQDYRSQ